MAYGLKYTSNFYQVKEYSTEEWRLEIYEEGFFGPQGLFNTDRNSIKLSRGGELLENVLGTKLTFSIINESEGEYEEFRTASYGDYKVVLVKDPNGTPVTKFVGYNQSEIYTEPYDQPPYSSVLEFTCGLSHLKHERFDNAGTLYEGQKTIIEVLRLCLNKLGTPLKIRDIVNVYEDSINSTTTDSMMNQIYVESSIYKEVKNEDSDGTNQEAGFFCYKVLEEILKIFNAQIYQWNGVWHIIRVQEYLGASLIWREFNPNVGTESTVTVDATGSYISNQRTITGLNGAANELILVAPSTEMSIEPPLNRIELHYDQKNLDIEDSNLIKNGDFEQLLYNDVPPVRAVPQFWSFTGTDYTTYQAVHTIAGTGQYAGIYYRFDDTAPNIDSAIDTGIYMSYSKAGIPTSTDDSLQFSFDIRVKIKGTNTTNNADDTFLNNNGLITFETEITFGSYYLIGDSTAGYSWSLTAGRATFEQLGLGHTAGANWTVTRNFSINVTLPNLPETSVRDFEIKIYKPYHNIYTYSQAMASGSMEVRELWSSDFDLIYLVDELASTEELVLFAEIDEDENVEKIDTIHGDGTNSATLNSFRLASTEITDSWARRSVVESTPILNLLLEQLRDLRGGFVRNLSGLLIGDFEMYNTIYDTTGTNTLYWIKNYNYVIETNEVTVNLMELTTFASTQNVDSTYGFTSLAPDSTNPIESPPDTILSERKIISPTEPINGNQSNLNGYI